MHTLWMLQSFARLQLQSVLHYVCALVLQLRQLMLWSGCPLQRKLRQPSPRRSQSTARHGRLMRSIMADSECVCVCIDWWQMIQYGFVHVQFASVSIQCHDIRYVAGPHAEALRGCKAASAQYVTATQRARECSYVFKQISISNIKRQVSSNINRHTISNCHTLSRCHTIASCHTVSISSTPNDRRSTHPHAFWCYQYQCPPEHQITYRCRDVLAEKRDRLQKASMDLMALGVNPEKVQDCVLLSRVSW